ncbi:hypothetical protein OESDEN_02959 [Oesophagostomum dentatum]|uniref:Tyrosine-protein kinase catalytic domain-containing protein n=1 Tax=Oesophagostomum dentatum TaxID=61180 RepID=A0A0B1THQ8_OESDE|nr:hypothetical protein OESDEN_02959 [Oesophagostomum dentatum]
MKNVLHRDIAARNCLYGDNKVNVLSTCRHAVISQGIMCWEIYNNGIEPYPGMTVAEVNQNVKEGYRMELPFDVPPDVQQIIKVRCWSENPNDRFSMADIAKHLQRCLHIPRPDFAAVSSLTVTYQLEIAEFFFKL